MGRWSGEAVYAGTRMSPGYLTRWLALPDDHPAKRRVKSATVEEHYGREYVETVKAAIRRFQHASIRTLEEWYRIPKSTIARWRQEQEKKMIAEQIATLAEQNRQVLSTVQTHTTMLDEIKSALGLNAPEDVPLALALETWRRERESAHEAP